MSASNPADTEQDKTTQAEGSGAANGQSGGSCQHPGNEPQSSSRQQEELPDYTEVHPHQRILETEYQVRSPSILEPDFEPPNFPF
eukprot:CAMPEP_0171104756 /NCGR_PEP_ID=MMETSP0766_2-20121228/61274_1 /TAXON_ID=439317 /ORGANISM="Gambierdiscus australes, Strain CAWD 149" /LENGTH=84 /DNA_ID=CAMNT_0011565433 /DNA_START=40 /DNA_END=294 /DNA_ORIENTATION=+